MKKFLLILAAASIAALLLAGCFNQLKEGEGTFTITIGGGTNPRSVLEWDTSVEISDLNISTILYDENDDERYRRDNLFSGDKVPFTVIPGYYYIQVEAYHNGELKAVGSASKTINSGPNGSIPVKMGPPDGFLSALSGTVTITLNGDAINGPVPTGSTLSAVYSGQELVSYQWKKNNAPIPGENLTELIPGEAGTYTVTVSARGYLSKTSGKVTVIQLLLTLDPSAGDFNISGKLTQEAENVTAITVTAKTDKSTGNITVYYQGISPTIYAKSTTPPQGAGAYAVTFDVASAAGWNAAYGLAAGTLYVTYLTEDYFELTETGTYRIIKGNVVPSNEVYIPEYFNGVLVTEIGRSSDTWDTGAFFYGTSNNPITTVHIPDTVTAINRCAFSFCTSLTNINIPESVTTIGESVFLDCESLTDINIHAGITSIGNYAFQACTSLTNLTFAEDSPLTIIGDYVFRGCSGLVDISIPAGITTIGEFAFSSCSGLTTVSMPGVTTIGSDAFHTCDALTSITIAANCDIGANSLTRFSFFRTYYNDTGKQAGTYVWDGTAWTGPN